jgi:hypothetical protein
MNRRGLDRSKSDLTVAGRRESSGPAITKRAFPLPPVWARG